MTKRPYAGFDPHEFEYDGVELAPLHDHDLAEWRRVWLGRARAARVQINVVRARELLQQGYKIAQIRFTLAAELGRPMPFGHAAVYHALRR